MSWNLRSCAWVPTSCLLLLLLLVAGGTRSGNAAPPELPPVGGWSVFTPDARSSGSHSEPEETGAVGNASEPPVASKAGQGESAVRPWVPQQGQSNTTTASVEPPASEEKSYPDFRVFGLLQADGIWWDESDAGQAVMGDIADSVSLRRTRIGAQGDLTENVGFHLLYDFSLAGRPTFVDAWGEVRDFGPIEYLTVGRFRIPQGMDALTNIPLIPFLERSTPTVLSPFRQTGLQAAGSLFDGDGTYAAAVYKYPSDLFGGSFGDAGYGAAGRLTALLWNTPDDDDLVHVGISLSHNRSNGMPLRYRATPGVGATFGDFDDPMAVIPPFVDTGSVPAESSTIIGYELAAMSGPLRIQSEALIARVDQIGGPPLDFPGLTVHAAWLITGERVPYDRRFGVFGRIEMEEQSNWGRCNCGAWEVTARWSLLNLTDANIQGGRLQTITLGLNWYLNARTRVTGNVIHAIVDKQAGPDFDTDIAAVRFQYDF